MFPPPDRRAFLAASTAFGFLRSMPPVSAAEAAVNPNLVAFEPEIEPLVRVLEATPREKVLEEIGHRIRKGTSYRDVLAALFLAGIRNVQPRPVGFKFHAVLVVNAAHLASLARPDRWLPLFWAIDNFKGAQAQNLKEGGWRMKPAGELKLPPSHTALEAFTHAMDAWDVEAGRQSLNFAPDDGPFRTWCPTRLTSFPVLQTLVSSEATCRWSEESATRQLNGEQ